MSFGFETLKFPNNVGSDQVPNYIRFVPSVMKYGGTQSLRQGTNAVGAPDPTALGQVATSVFPGSPVSGIGALAGNLSAGLNNLQQGVQGISQTIGSVTNAAQSAASQFQNNPSVAGALKAGSSLISKVFDITGKHLSFGLSVNPDKLHAVGSINLYLPQNLETNSSVDYETAALGGVGIAAVEASRQEALDASSALGQLLPGAIQDLVSSGNRRAAIGIATNRVTNNFSFQVFNSVLHRQFAYEFRMMAKDENESLVIKNICDKFLYFMLPARDNAGKIGMYEIPCQWNIEYQRKGERLKFHQQPKNCFLQSVDVGYGGDAGNSTYNDGAPMDVTLRLQFIEIEPLYREGGAYTKRPASLEADNGGSAGADLGQVTDRFNERPGLERS
tara:strand:- start:2830 stop:3996 length:1167 start_codon:yes stop_codon:yes gene_type:complete